MNLLSKMESYFQSNDNDNDDNDNGDNDNDNKEKEIKKNKTFLRKGCGTVNQRNKYEIERQKQAERKRQRQLGLIQTKPKTQKVILMEQWREKQKQKDKMLRKKKEQMAAIQSAKSEEINVNKINQQNFIRPTKSFEANINSTLTSKKSLATFNSMKLLKQKQKKKEKKIVGSQAINSNFENEQKTPSDELESASKFQEMQFEDAILIKQHVNRICVNDDNDNNIYDNNIYNEEKENKSNDDDINQNQEIGIWKKQRLPKKITVKPAKGYNFARHSSNDRTKTAHFPSYSHHHHTSLYGIRSKQKNNNNNNNDNKSIPNANKSKYYSESKNLFHKQATVNTTSKRDRLAAKYSHRKANQDQIDLEKQYLLKTQELQIMIEKYEEKCNDADMMKQSSLEAFRKYQTLINEKVGNLDQKQREFEKYKKKQERILCQKTSELDKRSRALLNIPDRKQRTQIEQLKKEINDLKLEFQTKEKRFKSKVERLKKQNKKLNQEKIDLQNELKKIQKQQLLEPQNVKDHHQSHQYQQRKPMTINTNTMPINVRKKKRYNISKIDVNTKRPKTIQSINTAINRSTNNFYEAYHHHHHHHNIVNRNEDEYVSTSSESSSSSDESTKNGEDEENKIQEKIENENQNHLPKIPDEYAPDKMTNEQYECECVKNRDEAIERMQHPDGKIEQVYKDGSKLILFTKGTEKYIFGNLSNQYKQIYVKFPNGDIKKILSDGSEVYFYWKNNIIHVTKTDGIELFYFNGQHEIHFPDRTKHILFADGTKKYIYPNGDEQCVFPNKATE